MDTGFAVRHGQILLGVDGRARGDRAQQRHPAGQHRQQIVEPMGLCPIAQAAHARYVRRLRGRHGRGATVVAEPFQRAFQRLRQGLQRADGGVSGLTVEHLVDRALGNAGFQRQRVGGQSAPRLQPRQLFAQLHRRSPPVYMPIIPYEKLYNKHNLTEHGINF